MTEFPLLGGQLTPLKLEEKLFPHQLLNAAQKYVAQRSFSAPHSFFECTLTAVPNSTTMHKLLFQHGLKVQQCRLPSTLFREENWAVCFAKHNYKGNLLFLPSVLWYIPKHQDWELPTVYVIGSRSRLYSFGCIFLPHSQLSFQKNRVSIYVPYK
uniref:Uncharacterized protein n=1 Tax=Micrurus paraensis TaxID=1970185 RepID=A0A2D4L461_9SAUR